MMDLQRRNNLSNLPIREGPSIGLQILFRNADNQ